MVRESSRNIAWQPHKHADQRRDSAYALVHGLIDLYAGGSGKITLTHCKVMLNIALWTVTEAEGRSKYLTRYCSYKARDEHDPSILVF